MIPFGVIQYVIVKQRWEILIYYLWGNVLCIVIDGASSKNSPAIVVVVVTISLYQQ